jgi:hypothetical protein
MGKKNFDVEKFISQILKYRNKSGELLNRNTSGELIYADLDDIVPFLLFFKKDEFVRQQIMLSKKYLIRGLYPLKGLKYIYSWRMDEYVGGVAGYLENNKDLEVQKIFNEQKDFLTFLFKRNYFPGYFNEKYFSNLIYPRGYNVVETVLDSSVFDEEIKFLAIKQLKNFIITNEYFAKEGLFSSKNFARKNKLVAKESNLFHKKFGLFKSSSTYFVLPQPFNFILRMVVQMFPFSRVQFMKDNSNLIFAIIEAYKHTKDVFFKNVLDKWIDSVLRKMYSPDGFIYTYYENGKPYKVSLADNYAFLDILCDYYHFVEKNETYLNVAKSLADYWLGEKLDSGLIAFFPGADYSQLDSQTDFSISLRRVYELTGEEKYKIEGENIYKNILAKHLTKKGLVLLVYGDGTVKDSMVSVKFNLLFLKAHILFGLKNEVYKDSNMCDLMKDR